MKRLLALALLLAAPLHAQTLGRLETFTQQAPATSWGSYDYATEETSAALWNRSNSGDPEIYASFTQNSGVSLFADIMSSGGSFVGDYDSAGIDTFFCDVFVEDLATFSDLEFYLLAGDTFYYSDFYEVDQSGWTNVLGSFSRDQWYIFDEDTETFVPVELTPLILSDVTEVGVNFYPLNDAADGKSVGLDNFALLPDLTPPPLTLVSQPGSAELSFTGIEGMQYTLQTSANLRDESWINLGSPLRVTGPSTTTVPTSTRGFFRVLSRPSFIEAP